MSVSTLKSQFNFASLFKTPLTTVMNIAKVLDEKNEQYITKLAKNLSLDFEVVRDAVIDAMLVYQDDEKSLKQKEKEEKQRQKELEKEKKKLEAEEKKRQKELEKEEKKRQKELEKEEKKRQKELEKEEKRIQKELEKQNKPTKTTKTKKSTSDDEKQVAIQLDEPEITKINDFDFASEPIQDISSDFWKESKKGKVANEKVAIQKTCQVAIGENNKCIGVFNKSTNKIIDVTELSNPVKKWIKKCNINIDYQDDDIEIDIDEEEDEEEEQDETQDVEIELDF